MKRLIPIIAALAILPLTAQAQENRKQPNIAVGVGTLACSYFAEWTDEGSEKFQQIFFSWAQGYFTAMNFQLSADQKPAINLAPESLDFIKQKQLLYGFCRRYPTSKYGIAVIYVHGILRKCGPDPSSTFCRERMAD